KGLSATKAITIGELTSVTGTNDIKIATAGTYDFYLTEDLGSFVVVAAGAGFPSVKEYKLYVYNLVGWSNIAVWAWDSSTNYTGGSWPGKLITDTEVINGHTYSVFTFPANANDKTIDVILNNNNAGAQTPTFSLTVNKDYYYRLEGTTAPVVIPDPNNPLPEVVVEKVARKITVKGPADWSKMNIHFWGGNSGATSWPGAAMTKNADGNFEYTFDKIDDGCTIGIVLNNGSGKQTGDITNVVLDSDLSYEVLNTVTNGKYNWKKL
ncbi:MAG: starch-binding protein, partial [Tidjanibacter sp.]|nr:starch-binding protein [Tidjanibacter sp.]